MPRPLMDAAGAFHMAMRRPAGKFGARKQNPHRCVSVVEKRTGAGASAHDRRKAMSIVRLIYVRVPADQAKQAQENWKTKCAPLMIQQKGCLTEELLRCTDAPGEFISYSEWDSEESIRKYLETEDHQEIKRHNRNIRGAEVSIKHYELAR
ncbi:MAG: hypothetical protein GEU92_02960 [Alphaproteobacteria bacterium]|nr:hypothetical protein [Alphaproteobacteria bacterium]